MNIIYPVKDITKSLIFLELTRYNPLLILESIN